MKNIIAFILLLNSINIYSQLYYSNSVELAVKNNLEVKLYDTQNGLIVDTLEIINNDLETCIVDIDSCSNGWVKIKKFYYVPWMYKRRSSSISYWMKINCIESALQPNFCLYDKASSSSDIIIEIKKNSSVYLKVEINDIKGTWVKIKFSFNNVIISGWVMNTDLCPLKHTTCNYPW